jgi:hypothetical protein
MRWFIRFLKWVVDISDWLVIRMRGAIAAFFVGVVLSLILILIVLHGPSDTSTFVQILMAIGIFVGTTLLMTLLGLVWPTSFVWLLDLIPTVRLGIKRFDE